MLMSRYLTKEERMEELLTKIRRAAHVHINQHFVYSGGDHGDGYGDYRPLGRRPEFAPILREVALLLLRRTIAKVPFDMTEPLVLIGPQTLGAQMVTQIYYAPANELEDIVPTRSLLRLMTFKKTEQGFEWSQSPQDIVVPVSQVVWFDDMLNAGSTFEKTNQLIKEQCAYIAAVCVIGNRSRKTAADLGVSHLEAFETLEMERYPEDECPLCKSHVPITRHPGHGWKFEQDHPDYPGGFVNI